MLEKNPQHKHRNGEDGAHPVATVLALVFALCSFMLFVVHVQAQSGTTRSGSTSQKTRSAATGGPKKKPGVFKTTDPCTIVTPDASLNLGPGVLGVQASSDGGTYHNAEDGCGLFIVDITVPNNSSGPSGSLPSFRIESGPVELIINGKNLTNGTNYAGGFALPDKVCALYHQQTRLFVKSSTVAEFTLIKNVKAGASFGQPPGASKCVLVQESGSGLLSYGLPFGFIPPKSDARVYRVAVGVVLGSVSGGTWQKVRVQASHDADIK
jgi:hypothetical protein